MNFLRRSFLWSCLSVLLVSMQLSAQVASTSSASDGGTPSATARGTHPFGSYGGSNFDQINLFNGNLSMNFPLATLTGRGGMSGSVLLSYNSKTWHVEEITLINGDKRYLPFYDGWDRKEQTIAPGFLLHAGRMVGRQTGWAPISQCPNPPSPIQKIPRYNNTVTRITFTSPDGTEYEFRDGFRFDANGVEDGTDGQPFQLRGCDPGQSRGIWFHTADGTAATFQSGTFVKDNPDSAFEPKEVRDNTEVGAPNQFYPSGIVMLRDGTRFYIVNGQVLKQRDRNGNVMRYEYGDKARLTRIVDNLGREITIKYTRKDITISAPGVGGVRREIHILREDMSKGLLRSDASIKTYSELFGDYLPDFTFGYENKFDPLTVQAIVLPTGHRWDFFYNSYGEVARVRTPSLGAIEYDYGREGGFFPPSGGPQIFRRVTERRTYPDVSSAAIEGKTSYSDPTMKNPDGSSLPVIEKHFDVANVLLAETRHWFSGSPLDNYSKFYGVPRNSGYKPWLEGKELRTAEIESGRELRVTEYTWEQRAPVTWLGLDRNNVNQPENDPRLTTVRTTWTDSRQVSESRTEYDEYTNVTRETVTDFGTNAPGGTILQEMRRSYVKTNPFTGQPYPSDFGIHLRSLVETQTVMGPGGTETVTRNEYDNYTMPLVERGLVGAAASTHDSTTYTANRKTRGNVTSMTAGFGSVDAAQSVIQYDVLGNPVKMTGPPNGSGLALTVETTYQAHNGGADFFAFPIRSTRKQITQGGGGKLDLTTSQTFDFQTGLVLSETGYHQEQVTFYEYNDMLDRLTKVRPAGLGEMRYFYSLPNAPTFVRMEKQFDGRFTYTTTFYDGLLKPKVTERSDQDGAVTTETTFDGLGRAKTVTNPHRGSGAGTDGSAETTYDQLSRVLTVTTRDATPERKSTGTVTTAYVGSTVTVTDQTGKQRRSSADPLGRVREVTEPDMTGALTVKTQYGYDARGNLLAVAQGVGVPGSGGQGRAFTYDTLGRLLTATVPESGLTRYSYDRASNLTRRVDARNVATFYSYDELGRALNKVYSDGTPRVEYFYDEALPANLPPNYSRGFSRGRLTAMVTTPSATRTDDQPAGTFMGYDLGGRAVQHVQMLDGQFYDSRTTYNAGSEPTQMTYPSGTAVGMTYNNSAQLQQVTRNGATLAEGVKYAATGGVTGQKLGNGLFHAMQYNSRFQPVSLTLGTTLGGTQRLGLGYDYGLNPDVNTAGTRLDGTRNNGNVGRMTIDVPGSATKEQDFGYDPLNRLKMAREYAQGAALVPSLTAINPPEGQQGTASLQVTLTGENLSNTSALTFTPSTGISVSSLTSTATSITATFAIAADAPLGPRSITATTPLGVTNSVIFTVTASGGGGVGCGGTSRGTVTGDASIYDNNRVGSGFLGVALVSETGMGSATLNVGANPGDVVRVTSSWRMVLTPGPNRRVDFTFRWLVNGAEAFTRTLFAETNAQGIITATNGGGVGTSQTILSAYSPGETGLSATVAANGPFGVTYAFSGQCTGACGGALPGYFFNSEGGLNTECLGCHPVSFNLTQSSGGGPKACVGASYSDGSAGNSASFTFTGDASDVTGPLNVRTPWGLRANLPAGTQTSVTFSFTVSGGGSFTRTLTAQTDASGTVTATNGHILGLGLVELSQAQGDGEVLLTTNGGGPLTVTYSFGSVSQGNAGVFPQVESTIPCAEPTSDCPTRKTEAPEAGKKAGRKVTPKQGAPLAWSQDYAYDIFGNLTGVTRNRKAQAIAVDAASNRLKSDGMVYDAAGNLIQDGAKIYTYDAENRMLTATVGSVQTRYFYDGDGARIKKVVTTNGTPLTTRFVYGPGGLLAEHEGATTTPQTPTREYFYGATGMLTVVEGTDFKYAMPDTLGSPRLFTDAAGNVVSRRDFYPFGDEIPVGVGGRAPAQGYAVNEKVRKKFTGYERDDETGLDFAQARYFSGGLGRFQSPDPLAGSILKPQSLNRYTYCLNNPLKYFDPSGLQSEPVKRDKNGNVTLGKVGFAETKAYPDDPNFFGALWALGRGAGKGGVRFAIGFAGNLTAIYNPVQTIQNSFGFYQGIYDFSAGLGQTLGDPQGTGDAILEAMNIVGWNGVFEAVGEGWADLVGIAITDRIFSSVSGGGGGGGGGGQGLARVMRHELESGPHISIEVQQGGTALHTEQVMVDSANNTTIAKASGLPEPTGIVEFDLPNAQQAMQAQRQMIGKPGGIYNPQTNSCVTHACDVLRAGGVEAPATTSSARRFFLRNGRIIK